MDYYAHVNYRPFSILAEGTNRLILGHWERKGKAYPLPVRWKLGLCQVLSAMVVTSTHLVSFCTSRFVPCSPFGPGLSLKLGQFLLSSGCWAGSWSGGSMLTHSPGGPTATPCGQHWEQEPPGAPATPNTTEATHSQSCIPCTVHNSSHRAVLLHALRLNCSQESLLQAPLLPVGHPKAHGWEYSSMCCLWLQS